jgi:ATP-dependent protease ClpP protease subunit
MSSINIQELFDVEREPTGSFFKTSKQEVLSHIVKLDEDIGPPSKYRDLITQLYTCDENAEFTFFVNSGGGSMSAAMAIIEGIRITEGKVRAIITGECHSAASIITLNCHEIVVTDSAHMMCHTANYGSQGNTHMVQRHVDFSSRYIKKILETAYAGFLSSEELVSLHSGIEFWFDSDEIADRLEARQAFLTAKATEAAKPVKKARQSRSKAVKP